MKDAEKLADELVLLAQGDIKLALLFACATLIELMPSEMAFKHMKARMAPPVQPTNERPHL